MFLGQNSRTASLPSLKQKKISIFKDFNKCFVIIVHMLDYAPFLLGHQKHVCQQNKHCGEKHFNTDIVYKTFTNLKLRRWGLGEIISVMYMY